MLSQERIKLMVRLEMNNSRTVKKSRNAARYFRSDYVAMAMIKTFFLVTIAYAFLVGLVSLGCMEFISDNITQMNIKSVITLVSVGYIAILAVYLVITIIVKNVKYKRSQRQQKAYERYLRKLEKLYELEEQ